MAVINVAVNLMEGDADGILFNGQAINTFFIWITDQIRV